MSVTITITNAGRAAMVNAQHTGTASVAIAAIGLSATAVTPDPAATSLPGEFKRVATVAGQMVAPDMIHVTMTDSSADAYSANAFAIYLADGTLFAIYGQASAILTKTAVTLGLLAVDIQLADGGADTISFGDTSFLNPPASETVQGVVELATLAEAQAGIDALRALTPAGARAAVLGYLLAQDGAGSGLDADMLDGQHGSYYADVPGRLGYTPVNRAGDTMSGGLTVPSLTIAGANGTSGLFAGNGDGASYTTANIVFQSWWGIAFRTYDGSINGYYDARLGLFDVKNGYRVNGSYVWHAGNDGTGSGLDADLWRGLTPAQMFSSGLNPLFGSVTVQNAIALTGVDSAEKALRFVESGGRETYLYGNVTNVGLYDTANGEVFAWQKGTKNFSICGGRAWTSATDGAGSGLDADLLDGCDWRSGQDVVFGMVDAQTPNAGSTGGIRLRGNAASGTAYMQITSADGAAQWGFWNYDASGAAQWNGAGGLRHNGAPVWSSLNDGAGSGLDADLLGGVGYGAYARWSGGTFTGTATFAAGLKLGSGEASINSTNGRLQFFLDGSNNERMAISSSNNSVQVGGGRNIGVADIQGSGSLRVIAGTAGGYALSTYDTQNYTAVQFVRDIGGTPQQVGTITCTDGGTSYNTSSDYRLKGDVRPIADPEAIVMAYRPCSFVWRSNGRRVNGFLAHEFAQVNPDAVHGDKDAMEEIGTATPPVMTGTPPQPLVDVPEAQTPQGWTWTRTGTRPVYQSMDASKAMPEVIAALQIALTRSQDQQAQIDALRAELFALKAA